MNPDIQANIPSDLEIRIIQKLENTELDNLEEGDFSILAYHQDPEITPRVQEYNSMSSLEQIEEGRGHNPVVFVLRKEESLIELTNYEGDEILWSENIDSLT